MNATDVQAPHPRKASPRRTISLPPATDGPKLVFGIGDTLDKAARSALARNSPVGMLSLTLDDPSDVPDVLAQRGAAQAAYRKGRAVNLIVRLPASRDPIPLSTRYGPACGDEYPLSGGFVGDLRGAVQALAGPAGGPALYVTFGDQVNRLNCNKNAYCRYGPDEKALHYYEATSKRGKPFSPQLQRQGRARLGKLVPGLLPAGLRRRTADDGLLRRRHDDLRFRRFRRDRRPGERESGEYAYRDRPTG